MFFENCFSRYFVAVSVHEWLHVCVSVFFSSFIRARHTPHIRMGNLLLFLRRLYGPYVAVDEYKRVTAASTRQPLTQTRNTLALMIFSFTYAGIIVCFMCTFLSYCRTALISVRCFRTPTTKWVEETREKCFHKIRTRH